MMGLISIFCGMEIFMPMRYKKLIVFFSFGILLIGFGTVSLVSSGFSAYFSESESGESSSVSSPAAFTSIQAVDGKSSGEIETELTELVETYFQAKQQVDMDAIADCVSNVQHVDEKKLLTESAYVEDYKNIQCTVMDGAVSGSYRVYVYYDVKIYDIDTLVPSLNALYIKQNDDGKFEIYLGALNSKEQKYIDRLDQSDKVNRLVLSVQSRLETVVSEDEDVRDFYEMLENAGDNDEEE
jgi:hypothetical protein